MQNVMPLRWRRDHEPTSIPEPPASPVLGRVVAPVDHVTVHHVGVGVPARREVAVARVDRIALRPLASLAIRCTLVATIVAALGVTLLWIAATATGVVQRVESFMQSIGFRDFGVSAPAVILGTVLIVGGVALVIATATVVVGAAYNAFALGGKGLQVRVAVADATDAAPAGGSSGSTYLDPEIGRGDPAA